MKTRDELVATMHDLRETLSAARPLISVSLRTATEMVRDALKIAESLYGRSRANNELLSALREASPTLENESEVEAVIETMELLLDDAPG